MLIGLRVDSPEADAALRRALAPMLVDAPSPPNYSLRFARQADLFHILSWGGCPVVRTLDVERLLIGLVRQLGGHGEPVAGLTRLDSVALVAGGRAFLVPARARATLADMGRELASAGFHLVDQPYADVDLRERALVVEDPRIPLDPGGLTELRTLAPAARRRDPAVPDGRYPLGAVVCAEWGTLEALPPGEAAYALARASVPLDLTTGREVLAGLVDLARRVPVVAGWQGFNRDVLDQLKRYRDG